MQDNIQIDYSQACFQMLCIRKHLLKDVTYFLYILGDTIILTNELQSQQPKYLLKICLENRICWMVDKDRQIRQFGFDYKGQVKMFVANDQELRELKSHLKNRIMFKDVSDFYQPIKLLGKGGSSKVYLVHEKDTKNDYASKCVEKRYLKEDGGYQALFNEINLMAELDYEFVVHLEEVYEGENTFYLILEHLKGSSLHDICSKGAIQTLGWEQIKSIMWQLLMGVAKMHKHDIMHRDLKPENIMFKDHNQINGLRIVDFGLATSCNVNQYSFPKCGTPGYVAPEIANLRDLTQKYDKICDMFSIGCIFYKLITLKDLFPGTDYHEILKLNKKCIINLDNLNIYRTPTQAMDLIQQMLQANPDQRITAQQALDHPFFSSGFSERKIKFQQQKKQGKLWQTSTFKMEKSDKLQLPEIRHKTRPREEDEVEDEKIKIKVPIMNSPRLAQHAQRKNLALADGSPTTETIRKSIFKKFSTQEFELNSPDTQSPDSARLHPTLVINNSPRLLQTQIVKKKFTYHKLNQQTIQEDDDEQKH